MTYKKIILRIYSDSFTNIEIALKNLINFAANMVNIENLSISYEYEVIKNFNLEVKKGEKIGLSGPSGVGKSTILHALLGFVEPTKGEIWINQLNLSSSTIKQIRKTIGWLPQELSLRFETVNELFYFPFSFQENKKQYPHSSEVHNTLNMLKLEKSILSKKTDEISGGQKQRIVLASQLLLKKSILLMDEPSSALDIESQELLLQLIRDFPQLTIISASHNQHWLKQMDRVIPIQPLTKI